MQERKPGCICELDSVTGNPTFNNYAECPVHKPDVPDPKQFAKDYIKMFEPHINWEDYDDKGASIPHAKQCAIKMVDEILNVLDTFQRHEYAKILIPFYQQVKKEIESL